MNFPRPFLLSGLLVFAVMVHGAKGITSEKELAPLKKMIEQGKDIRTLSAEIAESRDLKTLSRPVQGKGWIWFAAPASFRLENGSADRSVVIGNGRGIFLIRRKGGDVTCRRIQNDGIPPMTPLGIPGLFPGDYEAFLRAFRVESIAVSGKRCHAEMSPLGGGSLRGLSVLHLDFDTESGRWISLRIITRDGSSLLQEFRNVRINEPLPPELFDPQQEPAVSSR